MARTTPSGMRVNVSGETNIIVRARLTAFVLFCLKIKNIVLRHINFGPMYVVLFSFHCVCV